MKYLIKNGTVVSAGDSRPADLLIENEKIVKVEAHIEESQIRDTKTLNQKEIPCAEDAEITVIDASGKLIFPGFIDTHTHFDLDAGDFHTADDFYTGTKAAVAGGTTTILDFTTQEKRQTLKEALNVWHALADGKCSCDYGFHMSITDWNADVKAELKDMTRLGVSSYKLYMAYDNLKVDDKEIFEILSAIEEEKGIAGVHCENGLLISAMTEKLKAEHPNSVALHPKSRPPEVEAEAVQRLLTIAKLAETPVNIVHLSSKKGLEEVRRARAQGQQVFTETCPQYLIFDDSEYDRPGFAGAAFVLSPPLRKQEDIEALWEAIRNGEIDVMGTDHCSFHMKGQKTRGIDDFTKIPNGIPGVEHRPVLFYSFGVDQGKTDAQMMCNLLSERPAKLFGMYPNKGAIQPGSDADLVIWDPDRKWTITAKGTVQNADNTPYEGLSVTGAPEQVFLRGKLVAKDGTVVAERRGKYIHRTERQL